MSVSYSFLTRFFRKSSRTVTTTATLSVNRSHNFTGAASDLTLPTSARVGDRIRILGVGSGVFTIKQNALQTIKHLSSDTTVGTGGTLTAGAIRDCIELECVVDDTTWITVSHKGTFAVA